MAPMMSCRGASTPSSSRWESERRLSLPAASSHAAHLTWHPRCHVNAVGHSGQLGSRGYLPIFLLTHYTPSTSTCWWESGATWLASLSAPTQGWVRQASNPWFLYTFTSHGGGTSFFFTSHSGGTSFSFTSHCGGTSFSYTSHSGGTSLNTLTWSSSYPVSPSPPRLASNPSTSASAWCLGHSHML